MANLKPSLIYTYSTKRSYPYTIYSNKKKPRGPFKYYIIVEDEFNSIYINYRYNNNGKVYIFYRLNTNPIKSKKPYSISIKPFILKPRLPIRYRKRV